MIDKIILPAMKSLKVAEVSYTDVDALHRKITKRAPYRANRVVSLLSKMFALSIRWKMRTDNPCKGIERNQEPSRERYLKPDELERLIAALDAYEDQQAANIIRLLLLTGARRGEVLSMTWAQLEETPGEWVKPGATTKRKTVHRVPLSPPAQELLANLRGDADADAVYVFPGPGKFGHRSEIKKNWAAVCKAAGIKGARPHDLRHTYASLAASGPGASLLIIGGLLGHSQAQTTKRYAHLFNDPLRNATESVGAIVSGKPVAQVHELKKHG